MAATRAQQNGRGGEVRQQRPEEGLQRPAIVLDVQPAGDRDLSFAADGGLPGGAEGFEPMAIAVSRPRIAGFRQWISKAMRGRPDCGRRRSRNATATVARRCADQCRTRRSNWRSSRRSPFLNRAEPRQGHRTSIAAANAHRPLD